MKLLAFISEDFYFLSHRVGLLTGLQKLGWEVTLVTNLRACEAEVRAVGIPVRHVDLDRRSLSPVSVMKGAISYLQIVRATQPDLLMAVALKPILAVTTARFLGVRQPVLCAFAGLGTAFSGNSRSFSIRAARWGMERVFGPLLNKCQIECLFQNHDDAHLFLSQKWTVAERTHVIPGSGVVLEDFPTKSWHNHSRVVFLFAGRMLWDKGIQELISACRLLKQRGFSFVCRIAGLIDPESKAAVPQAFIEEQHAKGVIEWLGPRRDVIRLMSESDCFVFPTRYREGIPRVLLEASAAGLPMITTDMPGCREVVRSGYNGLVVPPGDVERLAAAMETCMRNREQLPRWGNHARKQAEAEYGVEKVIRRHDEILTEMARRNGLVPVVSAVPTAVQPS